MQAKTWFLLPVWFTLMAAASLAICPARGFAEVVYGNLGASGDGAIGSTNTDFGPADSNERGIAQGFTSGSSSQYLKISSITLGLFASSSGTVDRTVSIYSNSSGVPGTSLYTSSATAVGDTGKYTFTFSNANLQANTAYWIVPQGPASWYFNTPATNPGEQNGSGYAFLGTKYLNTSSQWVNPDFTVYSVSVVAVPEPGTTSLLVVAGLAAAALASRRRAG